MAENKNEGMLSPYRVLDLADDRGLYCAKLLGDLGADVIKVERPGGDPARNIGPFYHDEPDPEKSLFWFAFNTSKRGITLDIEKADGREILKKLVKSADFIVESFEPGYLNKLGLGYAALEKINPRIIMVSVSAFGSTGPYKDFKGPDIVVSAISGATYLFGEEDRPPIRPSHYSHAYLHASSEAAAGAVAALYYRQVNGKGQHVEVTAQEALTQSMAFYTWDMRGFIGHRKSNQYPNGAPQDGYAMLAFGKRRWNCKDGQIIWSFGFGPRGQKTNPIFVKWLDSEGMADDFLRNFDWSTFDPSKTPKETIDLLYALADRFFMKHTKVELYENAFKIGLWITPVFTTKDAIESPQLATREYWEQVEHPELGERITYPGGFVHSSSDVAPKISRRAPRIGEHNCEIYQGELGMIDDELRALKEAGVI